MRNETLVAISKRTGFSISTVSRVLSGQAVRYRISEKTIKLVSDEARRCNYIPNLLAKSLSTNRTNVIGLVIPCIENPYFANIASVVMQEAKQHGYTILLVDTMENEENERVDVLSLLSRKVDGIVIVPCGQDASFLESVNTSNTPVILIDRYFDDTTLPYVCTNNYQGAFDATKFLIENGHKRVACIQGVNYSMPNKERVRGYLDALKQSGIEHHAMIVGEDFSVQNGYLETKLVLSSDNRPSAIFTLSNTILLGAIKAIKESGLQIPEDISVVSFDNNIYLDYLDPSITRVSQPIDEIGILAIKILSQSIKDNTIYRKRIQIPPKLDRKSVV